MGKFSLAIIGALFSLHLDFADRLKQRGIRPRAGRNTALIQLASELPAAVLSDILGIDIATATRWAGYAKRDWQGYLASRHEAAQQL